MTQSTPIVALRSTLFFAGLAIIVLFFSISGVLMSPLPFAIRGRYMVSGNHAIMLWLRLTCGVNYRVQGEVPAGRFVALSKHSSQWETFFLQWYLFPACVVLKRELLRIPFFGWALKSMRAIAIDRGSPKQAMRQTMSEGVKRLESGCSVLIFPEGTRTRYDQMGRYARGGAGLAIQAGVPILPVAHNAGQFWPGRSFLIRPGTVTVVIGEPIPSAHGDSRSLTEQVRDWTDAQIKAISGSNGSAGAAPQPPAN